MRACRRIFGHSIGLRLSRDCTRSGFVINFMLPLALYRRNWQIAFTGKTSAVELCAVRDIIRVVTDGMASIAEDRPRH
jgi:hypothetical protein